MITLASLILIILLTGSFAWAEKITDLRLATTSPPQWQVIPGVPGVEYAPHIGQDLFRYQGGFFNFQGGAWFRAGVATGPWVQIPEPPQVFYNIQAPYFKVPPGWAKGKKTGWGGAPMPPGQMKKLNRGHVPPGKAKKFYGQPLY
jgi:hypothetical protein